MLYLNEVMRMAFPYDKIHVGNRFPMNNDSFYRRKEPVLHKLFGVFLHHVYLKLHMRFEMHKVKRRMPQSVRRKRPVSNIKMSPFDEWLYFFNPGFNHFPDCSIYSRYY